MKASCLRRRHSRRTAAPDVTYSGPFPPAQWQRNSFRDLYLVAKPAPPATPLVLHPGGRDGDDGRAAAVALRSRGRNRRRGGSVPCGTVMRRRERLLWKPSPRAGAKKARRDSEKAIQRAAGNGSYSGRRGAQAALRADTAKLAAISRSIAGVSWVGSFAFSAISDHCCESLSQRRPAGVSPLRAY